MTKYVALLRGINVGGKKIIKMEVLARIFTSLGFRDVRTYIASGNVIFESPETDVHVLTNKIEKKLLKSFGYEVRVLLRTVDDLKRMLKRNPFKKIELSADVMLFVTFFSAVKGSQPKLPVRSSTENLEVFVTKDGAAFILARRKKDGSFDFPNNFFEKEFGVSATTRNWNTVNKIVAVASRESD